MREQHLRHAAAARLGVLLCGCTDPWGHRDCRDPAPLTEVALDGWVAAITDVFTLQVSPMVPVEVLRALWRRGGDDRRLAQQVHQRCTA